jgi:hypothetical protein
MAKTLAEWMAQFRQHAEECRASVPLPSRDTLTPAEEWRCRIIGSSLLRWLRETGPRFLQERAVMHKILEIDRNPFIVFTSDMPGLVAAQEIVGADHEQVGFLLEDEHAAWPPQLVDPDYRWHVHVWSLFRPKMAQEFEAEARARYPIAAGCDYWQHGKGTMWAVSAGRGVDYLWQWDGHEPALLEEAFSHWVS